jgi:thymidylate synthase
MYTIRVRNVHDALPAGIEGLTLLGVDRESRNGLVRMFPEPVATRYERPCERVLFWEQRDANPFFHLYESLWMLAGKRDVASVAHYVARMATFSDDGKTFHGAYGYRWRKWFKLDQIEVIIHQLAVNSDDRRCVMQMWDTRADLGKEGKDFPCNISVVFAVNHRRELDMTVFNRSNDMIWGAYGANAVHFSVLQEYVALSLGLPVGAYEQVSTNFHGYHSTFIPLKNMMGSLLYDNPYEKGEVAPYPLWGPDESKAMFDLDLAVYMDKGPITGFQTRFFRRVVNPMHAAHVSYRKKDYDAARDNLLQCSATDWRKAAIEWINRRETNARKNNS